MPNYLETSVPGETRRRAHRLDIQNWDEAVPTVNIHMQDRINLATGGRVYVDVPGTFARFDAEGLAETFPLVNIDTGEPLGATMSGLELMVAVQSWTLMQMQKADQRPASPAPLILTPPQ